MGTEQTAITYEALARERMRLEARDCLLAFYKYFSIVDLILAWHVRKICAIIDRAVKRVEAGEDVFLCLNVCRQHGKSQISSRTLPAWILIRNPKWNVVLGAHSKPLAYDFAVDSRKLFRRIGPLYGLGVADDRDQIGVWRTTEGGGMYSTGITAASLGRGAKALILEDPFPDAIAAESPAYIESVWRAITQDFLPMRAPGSLVLFVCNRWGIDDPPGRIERLNDPTSGEYDPHFPKFEFIRFPAHLDAPDLITGQPAGWLFPERYSEAEYLAMRSILGSFGWASQAQQDPIVRGGNLLQTDGVQIVDEMPADLEWIRGWDLASSEPGERPDWTVGTKAAYWQRGIYVDDVIYMQREAPARNDRIVAVAKADGPEVTVKIESVAGYKDAFTSIKKELSGLVSVRGTVPQSAKEHRAKVFVPCFEAGKVFLRRASWNARWLESFSRFPKGLHDDDIDSLGVALHDAVVTPRSTFAVLGGRL